MNLFEVRPRGWGTAVLEFVGITSVFAVVIAWSWFGRAAGWW